jgi:hypothetical protein
MEIHLSLAVSFLFDGNTMSRVSADAALFSKQAIFDSP